MQYNIGTPIIIEKSLNASGTSPIIDPTNVYGIISATILNKIVEK